MTENSPRTTVKNGIWISILNFILIASSLIVVAVYPTHTGIGNFLWLLSLVPAVIGGLCYLSDLPRAIEDAKKNQRKTLDILLSAAWILGIPLALGTISTILWLPWHLLLFILELISLKQDS